MWDFFWTFYMFLGFMGAMAAAYYLFKDDPDLLAFKARNKARKEARRKAKS